MDLKRILTVPKKLKMVYVFCNKAWWSKSDKIKVEKNNNNTLCTCQSKAIKRTPSYKLVRQCKLILSPHRPHTVTSSPSKVTGWKERCFSALCPQPVTPVKEAGISLITVTIFHHVKTTFVLGTGRSASLEFLAKEQLLPERQFSLSSAEQATVTTWSSLSRVLFSSFPIAQFRA